jgi:hypothetical protein
MLDEIRIVSIVYISAFLPIYLLFFKFRHHSRFRWFKSIYLFSLILCAIGWELWFTYGLFDGFAVNERRSAFMNMMIPININWLINSLADAGAICMGGILLISFTSNYNDKIFLKWNWMYFGMLIAFTIGQNVFVELFLYFDQLSVGKPLSWAPFSPFGNFINPLLYEYGDRSIMLQSQLPWLFMTPLLYFYSIISYKRMYKDSI